jgi:hypothetical protein
MIVYKHSLRRLLKHALVEATDCYEEASCNQPFIRKLTVLTVIPVRPIVIDNGKEKEISTKIPVMR